ncbi:hypothetical protein D1632_10615 [Chryseobacterium nematophagum]|uniref:Uncharacterized protein n=1 Tax=Chryseobacterium nematophagum TaxID=2305228 RepID=A0A3M7LD78_9FLAO|nr:hypothetical protein [Chryseobacterium nematophagum]RMZ60035.1 hypothetical protein D1632_10615 [Chryseobacterium nematophagum]
MKILEHSKTISVEVSDLLKAFTTARDIADVNAETGVSVSTLNYVKRRAGNVSLDNEKGMLKLIERAYKNAETKRVEALRCKKEMKLILEAYERV